MEITKTNIDEYDVNDLIDMFNATTNNQDFADAYPDATFNRDQVRSRLSNKQYGLEARYIMLPKDISSSAIRKAIQQYSANDTTDGFDEKAIRQEVGLMAIEGDTPKRFTIYALDDDMDKLKHFVSTYRAGMRCYAEAETFHVMADILPELDAKTKKSFETEKAKRKAETDAKLKRS